MIVTGIQRFSSGRDPIPDSLPACGVGRAGVHRPALGPRRVHWRRNSCTTGVADAFARLATGKLRAPANAASGVERVDLRESLTPVKDQGQYRGTCAAFAATALMEFLIKSKTHQELDLSEQDDFWAARRYALARPALKEYREAYAHSDGIAGFLAVEGYQYETVPEADWPYEAQNWQQRKGARCRVSEKGPDSACFTGVPPAGRTQLPYRLRPVYVEPAQIGAFILREKRPVVMNIKWIQEVVDTATGRISMPTAAQAQTYAGHTVLLCGYDLSTRAFIFRNSWGPSWGDHGYGTIPEEYVIRYGEIADSPDDPRHPTSFAYKGHRGVSGYLIAA
jgi:hypothetical protein